MCKHGVALILEWIDHKDSFLDADDLMVSLEAKDKNELLDIINLILEEDPFLASKLWVSKEIDEVKVNLESISTRIDYSMEGFIDYYAVSSVVHELEEVKKIADNQGKEGNLRDAIEKNKDDYLRIASFLVGEGRSQEAFVYVTEGLQLKEERNYSLDKLYFDLMNRFSDEKWLQVNERDALGVAVNLLSYHRDIKKYSMIKRLFIKIGKYDELLQAIITKCDDSVVIPILLKKIGLMRL
jgi:hypothetical protein